MKQITRAKQQGQLKTLSFLAQDLFRLEKPMKTSITTLLAACMTAGLAGTTDAALVTQAIDLTDNFDSNAQTATLSGAVFDDGLPTPKQRCALPLRTPRCVANHRFGREFRRSDHFVGGRRGNDRLPGER